MSAYARRKREWDRPLSFNYPCKQPYFPLSVLLILTLMIFLCSPRTSRGASKNKAKRQFEISLRYIILYIYICVCGLLDLNTTGENFNWNHTLGYSTWGLLVWIIVLDIL